MHQENNHINKTKIVKRKSEPDCLPRFWKQGGEVLKEGLGFESKLLGFILGPLINPSLTSFMFHKMLWVFLDFEVVNVGLVQNILQN